MLSGEAVVAIWSGIVPEIRDQFYDWYINEHSLERVGIPGFRRGRRYIAADSVTHPEFFAFYEADSMQVLQGGDYANRLNNPTPATRTMMASGRDTFRAVSRVNFTHGPGIGGIILTIRFDCDDIAALRALVLDASQARRVTGAHLCIADAEISAVRSAETRNRDDMQAPPALFVMVEATGVEALAGILPDATLKRIGAREPFVRGIYRLEYVRTKTGFSP
jgi:hypothetical protein